jgi:hypothetical protein
VKTKKSRWARLASVSMVLAGAALLTGCGWMARRMANALASQQIAREFTLYGGKAAAFRQCLASAGGECADEGGFTTLDAPGLVTRIPLRIDPAVLSDPDALADEQPSAAARALLHPVQSRLSELYNVLSELPAQQIDGLEIGSSEGGAQHVTLELPTRDVEEYVELVAEATQGDQWASLAEDAMALDADSPTTIATKYIATYVKAYFRGGQFFSLDVDQGDLLKTLRQGLGSQGFVTRSGAIYQFPAVDMRFDPVAGRATSGSDIEMASVASDLVRVVLEAVFDSRDRLPAVTGATGLSVPATGAALKVHDPETSPISAERFGDVNGMANQSEAAVSAAVGPLIRGVGWTSLNNETLAKLIETFVAVTVRKVTEKAAWCWYACEEGEAGAENELGERVELKLVVGG